MRYVSTDKCASTPASVLQFEFLVGTSANEHVEQIGHYYSESDAFGYAFDVAEDVVARCLSGKIVALVHQTSFPVNGDPPIFVYGIPETSAERVAAAAIFKIRELLSDPNVNPASEILREQVRWGGPEDPRIVVGELPFWVKRHAIPAGWTDDDGNVRWCMDSEGSVSHVSAVKFLMQCEGLWAGEFERYVGRKSFVSAVNDPDGEFGIGFHMGDGELR